MTMTLDEVRKTRFHMSRRNGYEVTDVDIFVDKVEATLIQITEQNEHLRRQLEATQSGAPSPELQGELHRLRTEVDRLQRVQDDVVALQQENQRLHMEIDEARASQGGDQALLEENQRLRQAVESQGRQAADANRFAQENDRLRQQVQELQGRVDDLQNRQLSGNGDLGALPLQVSTSSEASAAVVRLVQLATEQAEALVNEAKADATRRLAEAEESAKRVTTDAETLARQVTEQANSEAARLATESQTEAQRRIDEAAQKAHELTTDARTKADRVESEARVNAERLTQDAQARANSVDREAAQRRTQLFADLESERDDLVAKVQHLTDYEATFRANLTDYLRKQITDLESKTLRPDNPPSLGHGGSHVDHDGSATPRLDALLHDQG